MKVFVRRVKKGEECTNLTKQGGYVGFKAPEDGYMISINYKSAFIGVSDMKNARKAGGEEINLERYGD
jgi:hypothetical protein